MKLEKVAKLLCALAILQPVHRYNPSERVTTEERTLPIEANWRAQRVETKEYFRTQAAWLMKQLNEASDDS